jgi:hypothetical protein
MGCCSCDFNAECHFLNCETVYRPLTTACARTKYCQGDFTGCTIYQAAKIHGISKVPRYVSPGDKYELHSRIVENGPLSRIGR